MTNNTKIPLEVSLHLRYLSQDKGETLVDLCKRYPKYSKTSIFRHSKKPIGDTKPDRRVNNKKAGRKKLLTDRDVRQLNNSLVKLRMEYGTIS